LKKRLKEKQKPKGKEVTLREISSTLLEFLKITKGGSKKGKQKGGTEQHSRKGKRKTFKKKTGRRFKRKFHPEKSLPSALDTRRSEKHLTEHAHKRLGRKEQNRREAAGDPRRIGLKDLTSANRPHQGGPQHLRASFREQ